MLTLVALLHLSSLGEPRGIHLLPDGALAQATSMRALSDPEQLQQRIAVLTTRISQLPMGLPTGSMVVASIGFTVGGLSLLIGAIFLLVEAISPVGLSILVPGIVFASLGLFLVGMSVGALIMGSNEMRDNRAARERLLEERRQLDLEYDRVRRPYSEAPTGKLIQLAQF